MTTMNSDSESQDSDEGRRFRFEATRKDSLTGLHSRKRRTSPARPEEKRVSRSSERNNRDRRDFVRSRHDEKKSSRSSKDSRRSSRDGESRNSRERNDPRRSLSRYRDSNRDSKNSSNSSVNNRETKLSRDSSSNSSRRSSKTRERDKRRSKERSNDVSHDEKNSMDKYSKKLDGRKNWNDRERSRESFGRDQRFKTTMGIENAKIESRIKLSEMETLNVVEAKKNVESTMEDEKKDFTARLSASSSSRIDCNDLNLSDFDIVSDVDENSSDSFVGRKTRDRILVREKNVYEKDDDGIVRKNFSKNQYERLLKRQNVKKRRIEDIRKVMDNNGDSESGTSGNNFNEVSDLLIGEEILAMTTTTTMTTTTMMANANESKISTNETNLRRKITKKYLDDDDDANQSDNSHSTDSNKGTTLLTVKNDKTTTERVGKIVGKISQSGNDENIAVRVIGPVIPDHIRQIVDRDDTDVDDAFGPALPPHLERRKDVDRGNEDETLAVSILDASEADGKNREGGKVGPADFGDEDDDDGDVMGPLPVDHPALESDFVQRQLEIRARRLKAELAACDDEEENKREEWMIELPPAQTAHLGLGPRKFRVRPAPDMSDRSSWTDTPVDRARKRMEKLENRRMDSEPAISRERDAPSASCESKKSKKRQQSLVELHQKELHKKKKKEEKEAKKIGKTVERRPFDRDIDLQANRFDEARKKSAFSKARELDDRFSRGKI